MNKYQSAYFVNGMQRSGNHAIINWMQKQMTVPVTFLNNREPWLEDKPIVFDKDKLVEDGNLIVSYEDIDLRGISRNKALSDHMRSREAEFGEYDDRYDILILRDPFNLFASRFYGVMNNKKIRMQGSKFYQHKMSQKTFNSIELWKSHAKIFLKAMDSNDSKFVTISFNAWFQNKQYRKKRAKELGIEFTDAGINDVPVAGTNSSSFDARKFDGSAQKMNVLKRWEVAAKDQRYRKLFKDDDEIFELSERIFGKIKGIDKLRQRRYK